MIKQTLVLALGAALCAAPLAAQEKTAAKAEHKMDHKMEGKMEHGADHAMSSWKELDAYHMLMMATWHPAKDKNDLSVFKLKAKDMVASAKLVATSKAPSSCGKPEFAKAQADLPGETEKVAAMVAAKAGDAELKASLKALHDKFEVLEGCAGAH